jgi:hypothetical protein
VAAAGTVLEVADSQLTDRVAAMIGVQLHRAAGAVGDEAVVAPVRPQTGLRADKAAAAHDQAILAKGGLGHRRDAAVGGVDVDPGGLLDGGDRRRHGLVCRTVIENRR